MYDENMTDVNDLEHGADDKLKEPSISQKKLIEQEHMRA